MTDNKNPLSSLCSVKYIKSNIIINTGIGALCTLQNNYTSHHVWIIKYKIAPIIKSSDLLNLKLTNKFNFILPNMIKAVWPNSEKIYIYDNCYWI